MLKKIIKYKDFRNAISTNKINDLLFDNNYEAIQFKYLKVNEDDDSFIKFKFNFVSILVSEITNVKISERRTFDLKNNGIYCKDKLILEKNIEVEGNIITETYVVKNKTKISEIK